MSQRLGRTIGMSKAIHAPSMKLTCYQRAFMSHEPRTNEPFIGYRANHLFSNLPSNLCVVIRKRLALGHGSISGGAVRLERVTGSSGTTRHRRVPFWRRIRLLKTPLSTCFPQDGVLRGTATQNDSWCRKKNFSQVAVCFPLDRKEVPFVIWWLRCRGQREVNVGTDGDSRLCAWAPRDGPKGGESSHSSRV